MRTEQKVFNDLIETIVRSSGNNIATITDVKLWAKSWQTEMEQELTLTDVVTTLPNIESDEFYEWMTDNGYTDKQYGTMQKGNKRYCINNLFKHYCNLLEFGN